MLQLIHIAVIIAAGISTALGGLVLIGWYTHSVSLIQVLPTFVPMQFNTALGFLLCGIGLFSQSLGLKRLAVVCGVTAGTVGSLTILQYISGADFGIDQLFMKHYIIVKSSHPGRMAPNTATCFFLSGVALAVRNNYFISRRFHLAVGPLGAFIVALGLAAFIGYLGGIETAYGWGALTRMAVHTAAGFVILGTGIFMLAWRNGVLEDPTSIIPPYFALSVGLGITSIAIIFWQALMTHYSLNHSQHSQHSLNLKVLPYSILIAGLLMSALMVLVIRLAQASSLRAAKLEETTLELERDIMERKLGEEALRASEEQFRGVVDNLGIGISLISPNMEVLSLNEQMRSWFPDIDPSKRPVCYQAFNSTPREGMCSYCPTHLTLEDGEVHVAETETPAGDETRHYKVVASPLRDREGKIVAAIEMVEDITERKQAEEHIHNLAYFDALTGLPNRKLFFDRLDQGICRVERDEQSLALLYIDLDNFKNINDMLGHPAGDMLLKAVGKRLSENMRKSTTVARLGGDEFAIIIEDMSNQLDVTKVADRIIDSLKVPLKLRGHEVFISASLGIAIYPNDGDDVKTLLKNADTAMYHAKKQGRNNYQFFSTEMNVELEKRVGIATKLRYALEKNEFTLCYQPQVELENGTIIGVESLIRWHPDGGESISPADFIPVAEETSLILEIDRWVLYTACTQMRLWQEAGFVNRRISVNISGFHFRRARILEAVDTVLEETGLKPDCLEIEITEGVLMEDVNEAVSTLDQLRSRGVHIAVDDFGTGYSSLSYLRRFPINRIKIDRSFISDIATDQDNAAITRTIIAMAHNLNLEVIAEGVETKEQLDFLRAEGCNQVQGYYFSKPLPTDKFTELIIKGQERIS